MGSVPQPLLTRVLLHRRQAHRESLRDPVFGGAAMATPVTLFVNIVNTHEDKNLGPSLPDPHACEDAPTHMGTCSNTDEHGEVVSSLAGRRVAGVEDGLVIALGGSSSPALCTSRTGAGGAPCSGRTRPGHRASPGVSAERKEEEGSRWGQEGATRKTETRSEAGRVTEREKEREGGWRERGGKTDTQGGPRECILCHRGCFPRHQGLSRLSLSLEAQAEASHCPWVGARAVGGSPIPTAWVWMPLSHSPVLYEQPPPTAHKSPG